MKQSVRAHVICQAAAPTVVVLTDRSLHCLCREGGRLRKILGPSLQPHCQETDLMEERPAMHQPFQLRFTGSMSLITWLFDTIKFREASCISGHLMVVPEICSHGTCLIWNQFTTAPAHTVHLGNLEVFLHTQEVQRVWFLWCFSSTKQFDSRKE